MKKSLIALSVLLFSGVPTAALAGYADDRAEIENLQAKYLVAMDARDSETYAETFAPDGVLVWAGGTENGRAEIIEANANWRSAGGRGGPQETWPSRTRHVIVNQVINVHGDTADGVAYWIAFTNNTSHRQVEPLFFGHYKDEMVKLDGKWFFKRREIFNESAPNRRLRFYPELGERAPE